MREMICIVCPRGCRLKVNTENGIAVAGNACPRGEQHAVNEILNPVRVITSTVRIKGALHRRCPVKTDAAIPKGKIFEAMDLLDGVELVSQVTAGQIVAKGVCGTDANFITTRDM